MHRSEKERLVEELTERLSSTETLIVADYRGLTVTEIDELRGKLIEQGARFTVVKNTLTKRAAEAAGVEGLVTLLDGPTAIAFLETDGTRSRSRRRLTTRARLTSSSSEAASSTARRSAPTTSSAWRSSRRQMCSGPSSWGPRRFADDCRRPVRAPMRDLVGVIDARIKQLEEQGGGAACAAREHEAARRLELVPPELARVAPATRAREGAEGAAGAYALVICGGGSQLWGSPSQQPSLNRHRGHCQVPWRHSIGAAQRKQVSVAGNSLLVLAGSAA